MRKVLLWGIIMLAVALFVGGSLYKNLYKRDPNEIDLGPGGVAYKYGPTDKSTSVQLTDIKPSAAPPKPERQAQKNMSSHFPQSGKIVPNGDAITAVNGGVATKINGDHNVVNIEK